MRRESNAAHERGSLLQTEVDCTKETKNKPGLKSRLWNGRGLHTGRAEKSLVSRKYAVVWPSSISAFTGIIKIISVCAFELIY